jgi:hypothetical protein
MNISTVVIAACVDIYVVDVIVIETAASTIIVSHDP